MKPFARFANRTWIGGILTAVLGVALSRLAAPYCAPGTREWVDVVGQITAFAGLFIIATGVNRRLRSKKEQDCDEG